MRASSGLVVLAVTGALAAGAVTSPATARPAAAEPALTAVSSGPAPGARKSPVQLTRWGVRQLGRGTFEHTGLDGGVVVGRHPERTSYHDPYGKPGTVSYDQGRWYSPWVEPGFGLTELIASYEARTPKGTFITVSARGRTRHGVTSSWDSLGRWASHDTHFHRMSLGAQTDDLSRVAVDTLVTDDGVAYASWQLRVSLMRRTGSGRTPTVTSVGAVASRSPDSAGTSRPGRGRGRSLAVPRYSQQIHVGEYPRYNGGGEAWCSPTSTSMVVAYWGRGPTARQYRWVDPGYADPWVDYAARFTYASGYDGTGDWPFNTAYAARFHLDAFVTRLRSLREAELFIRAGIPLVASISFGTGELDGAPIGSTAGHLVVVRGFTDDGRVIVNDPAASSNATVRRVYKRGQFERAWVGATGGVVYVIHPSATPLPAPRRHSNW